MINDNYDTILTDESPGEPPEPSSALQTNKPRYPLMRYILRRLQKLTRGLYTIRLLLPDVGMVVMVLLCLYVLGCWNGSSGGGGSGYRRES